MRITFKLLQSIAKNHGFVFDRCGDEYELFSNELAPGTTGVYNNLDEAWDDVAQLTQGINPLA